MKEDNIITSTDDGSLTLVSECFGESYHSTRGALSESLHVFINAALKYYLDIFKDKKEVSIFEVGFGTGLNAMVTMRAASALNIHVNYYAIELYPLDIECVKELSYGNELLDIHNCNWNICNQISDNFAITKILGSFPEYKHVSNYDIVYYDAFSPDNQPEMWSLKCFEKLFSAMNAGGVMTTYCAKGDVRRAMLSAGFNVEKIKGALGKRHMLRARKL